MIPMLDEADQKQFDVLAQILDEEPEAQFGVGRGHQTPEDRHMFAVLLADPDRDRVSVVSRLSID